MSEIPLICYFWLGGLCAAWGQAEVVDYHGRMRLTEQSARRVLREAGWPEERMAGALRVMWCESKGVWTEVGDNGHSLGLFQIQPEPWTTWGRERGWTGDLMAPVDNARLALLILEEYDLPRGGPWRQWTCKGWWRTQVYGGL